MMRQDQLAAALICGGTGSVKVFMDMEPDLSSGIGQGRHGAGSQVVPPGRRRPPSGVRPLPCVVGPLAGQRTSSRRQHRRATHRATAWLEAPVAKSAAARLNERMGIVRTIGLVLHPRGTRARRSTACCDGRPSMVSASWHCRTRLSASMRQRCRWPQRNWPVQRARRQPWWGRDDAAGDAARGRQRCAGPRRQSGTARLPRRGRRSDLPLR